MLQLLDLPSDILFDETLSRLSWPSISACLSTCTTLRDGINASPWLSYQKELYLAAMIDNPRSSVPLPEKIERLKTRETRWTQFTPRSISVASMLDVNEGHYDVESGLYVLGRKELGSPMTSVIGWKLPADEDEAHEGPVWEGLTLDARIIDFGMSVHANDLIVFACQYVVDASAVLLRWIDSLHLSASPQNNSRRILVYLRQWSTKGPHPLASCPILETNCHDAGTVQSLACLRVCGDTLAGVFQYRDALLERRYSTRLCVWHWKTGKQVGDIPVAGTSVLFLREDIILVPNPSAFALDIYLISTIDSSDSTPPITPLLQLCFPAFASPNVPTHAVTTYIWQCTVEPSLTKGSPQYLPSSRPFSSNPAESIVYFSIDVETSWGSSSVYDVLVHRRTLLQLSLSSLEKREGQNVDDSSTSIAWEDWGPDNCRMFDTGNSSNPFVTCANGTRFASLTPSDNDSETRAGQLSILNFNRAKVRHAEIEARDGKVHNVQYEADTTKMVRLVDRGERTVIEKSDLFKEDVVTMLPYLCTTVVPAYTSDRTAVPWDAGMLSE